MTEFRVLLVVPLYNVGGTELSTLSLARGLREAGHRVYVMCNRHPLADEFAQAGAVLVEAGMQRNIRGLLSDAATMRRCLADHQIQIIHFQSAFPIIMTLQSRRAIRAGGVKAIWTCRGVSEATFRLTGRVFNHLLDFVIANCDATKSKLVSNGLSPSRVQTIYNCPTIKMPQDLSRDSRLLSEIGLDPETQTVGTASRLREERGVNYFLDAAAVISEQSPQARFLIAGAGPQEEELRQQASRLGIERKVHFLGARRDMDRIYPLMDVFVNPSVIRFGTDNVNIEAMAFARPVIVSDVGGGREIVADGVTGFVVPPRDAPALAEATVRLLKDNDLARRMGLAGRERILKDFTVERMVREVEAVYAKVRKGSSGS